jgi:hypothetical protein
MPSTPPKDLTFFSSISGISGISGSALADAAWPASMMIKMMDKAGFDRPDAVALTASTTMAWKAMPDILSRSALLTASVFARGDGAVDLRAGIVKLAAPCHGFQIIAPIIQFVRRVSDLFNQVRPPKAQAV